VVPEGGISRVKPIPLCLLKSLRAENGFEYIG
jgi:hypothetical protein